MQRVWMMNMLEMNKIAYVHMNEGNDVNRT